MQEPGTLRGPTWSADHASAAGRKNAGRRTEASTDKTTEQQVHSAQIVLAAAQAMRELQPTRTVQVRAHFQRTPCKIAGGGNVKQ